MPTVAPGGTVVGMGHGPSIEMCLAGRDITEPRLSPDGATVAFISRVSGGPASLTIVPADGGAERIIATAVEPTTGRGRNGGVMCWSPDGDAIVHVGVDHSLWWQPIPSGVARRLAVFEGPVEGPCCSPDGTQVVVSVNRGAMWAVSTAGEGRARRLDDGRHDFCIDPVIVGLGRDAVVWWQAWSVPNMAWDHSVLAGCRLSGGEVVHVEGVGQVQQPQPLADGRMLCLRDDHGWLNVWLDDVALIDEPFEHGGPTWGPGQRSVVMSPDGSMVAFHRNEQGFGRLCVFDIGSGVVHEVARGVHGQLHWAGETLTALRSGARTPTQIVAYRTIGDPATWQRTTLAVGPSAGWEHLDLPEPETHRASTAAGHHVPFRRYAANQGRSLIAIHGGPTDQWEVEFLVRIAYWWSRGWDVIVPDPRGSTGHGRDYMLALHGEWGRGDVADVRSVIEQVHRERWSIPASTVVMGSSSGGMAALGVAVEGAGLIAGCIALYPVTDAAQLAERSHRYEAHYTTLLIGPEGDPAFAERSLIGHAARIDVPVLLLHGTSDPVVPIEQSQQLAAAIEAAGGTVTFEQFEGEGHGFRQPAHRRAEYQRVGEFLDRVRASRGDTRSSLSP